MKPSEKKDALWEIINCGVWFPVNFAFGIGMKDPAGQPIKAGSIDLLWRGLEYLNETNWGANARRHRRLAHPRFERDRHVRHAGPIRLRHVLRNVPDRPRKPAADEAALLSCCGRPATARCRTATLRSGSDRAARR